MGRLGKFEGNEDQETAERLHGCTLDGGHDEELGTVDTTGWWALVADYKNPVGDPLDLDWYVVTEDNDGFFDIIYGPMHEEKAREQFESIRMDLGAA